MTDTDRRGAQVFAVALDAALAGAGHTVDTVALAPGSFGGLDVKALGTSRLGWRTLRALRRRLRTCDVVIAHGSSTLPACAFTTLMTNVPFVYRQISDSRFWAPAGPRRARVRAELRRAARVVALWSGAAETLASDFGVDSSRLWVIPNAVDPHEFAVANASERERARAGFGLDPDCPTVGYMGALVPEKGVDVVIDALGRVDGAQLLVAGLGPERDALEAQAAAVAPGRVVFAGSVTRAREVYAAVDVMALASRGGDSMPAVLIEAGLMGVPSVATPVEAIPEIVLPEVTGSLVPVDAPGALADSLSELITDDARRAQYGAAAADYCRGHFTIASVVVRWSDMLRELA
jgi:glycosyltransferase involved in cell wall biosynthesis